MKGAQCRRNLVAEYLLAQLGTVLGAPVPSPALVNVPASLAEIVSREGSDVQPGVGFGASLLPGLSPDAWRGPSKTIERLLRSSPATNAPRLAALAILYGWFDVVGYQILQSSSAPFEIYATDHGHGLPGGADDWTVAAFDRARPAAPYDLIARCLTDNDLADAIQRLRALPDADIVRAVAAPSEEWGVTTTERVELAAFLMARRDSYLDRAPAAPAVRRRRRS